MLSVDVVPRVTAPAASQHRVGAAPLPGQPRLGRTESPQVRHGSHRGRGTVRAGGAPPSDSVRRRRGPMLVAHAAGPCPRGGDFAAGTGSECGGGSGGGGARTTTETTDESLSRNRHRIPHWDTPGSRCAYPPGDTVSRVAAQPQNGGLPRGAVALLGAPAPRPDHRPERVAPRPRRPR